MNTLENTSPPETGAHIPQASEAPTLSRREAVLGFLATAGALAAPKLAEAGENDPNPFEVAERDTDMARLHSTAGRRFANELGEYLRSQNNLIVTEMQVELSEPDAEGRCILTYRATFRKVKEGEKPDRHTGRRGTMLDDPKKVDEAISRIVFGPVESRDPGVDDRPPNWIETMELDLGPISTIEVATAKNSQFYLEEYLVVTKGVEQQ